MKIDWLGYMVQTYLSAEKILYELRDKEYPVFSVVRMTNGTVGVVMKNEACPPNKLPIKFENDNTWFKDLSLVACRIDNKKLWSNWARRTVVTWRRSACNARQGRHGK
jgi:hypothetical protein